MTVQPSILFVAHPGHELRLHYWLSIARPAVHVLTDGSGGSGGVSRILSTVRVINGTNASQGSIFGRFTDEAVYRAMLTGDAATFAAVTRELAEAIVTSGAQRVVADAWEYYNPAHDLCRFLADLAVEQARLATGRSIESCAFDVTVPSPGGDHRFVLDDEALARKIAAAKAYPELGAEVDAELRRGGEDALRHEHLHRLDAPVAVPPPASHAILYETRGEEQVAKGKYATVLRYRTHVAPLLAAIAHEVRSSPFPRARVPVLQS